LLLGFHSFLPFLSFLSNPIDCYVFVGVKARFPHKVIATAAAFFHRFFHRNDPAEFDQEIILLACLFLAGLPLSYHLQAKAFMILMLLF
jgi:hypothetical protein